MWSCCIEFFAASMLHYITGTRVTIRVVGVGSWASINAWSGLHQWLCMRCGGGEAVCDDGAVGRHSRAALWSIPSAETS